MAEIGGTRNWLRGEKVTVTESPGRLFVDYEPPPSPGFPIELKGFAGVVIHTYNGVDGLLFGLEAGLKERREGLGPSSRAVPCSTASGTTSGGAWPGSVTCRP